jgi:hypothetical protein
MHPPMTWAEWYESVKWWWIVPLALLSDYFFG